jgi:phage terminase large subunit GpA-like protein
MDSTCDPSVREAVFMKSAQVGWTEALNNTIGYHVDQDPAPVLLLHPTLEMAEAWSKDRLAPMIRDTPCLTGRIADPKARDSGNTLLHKRFTGGHLTIVGANSPSGLASRPIRVLLCDEVDRFPVSAGTEGDPIDLARRRTATFRNRKVLMGSTPTVKGASRIEAAFEQSDQRYYFVPCPHCEEFQRLVWSQVRWEEGRPETAAYACQHCGVLLSDADKPEMLRRGEWRAAKPFNGIAGFHISELYSPWSSWPDMASAFLRAKRFPETLQTWINTALGETWEEQGQTVEPEGLLARREPYGPEELPAGVLLLTVGGDVQDDRIEAQLLGWGANEECWILEQAVFPGNPGNIRLWSEEIDAYLKRRYRTEDGRTLAIEAAGFDSGGHHTQTVYEYCVVRRRFRIWAIKGQAGPGRLAWPKRASRVASSRVPLHLIGVDTIKSTLYGRLEKVASPGAGYIHLPQSFDEEHCRQLTSETRVRVYVKGRPVIVWKPRVTNIRQEVQDCWVYGYAAMVGRGGSELLARRARRTPEPQPESDVESEVSAPEPTPPASAAPESVQGPKRAVYPPRRGWVKGWRF